jgi:hypothetical protein
MDAASPRRPRSESRFGSREAFPLLAGYWAFGQFWGAWVILVFDFQRAHAISESRLGVLYTVLSAAAVLVMLLLAPRMQPLPLVASVPFSLTWLGAGAFAIAYLPTSAILWGFLLVGAGNGLIDVYLNIAAQRTEAETRRPVLQWLHASYAFGGITGATVAGVVRTTDLDFRLGIAYTGIALLATAALALGRISAERPPVDERPIVSVSALFRTPSLWVPAFVVLSAFLVEGSMDTWSGLYLREELGASAGSAALAFVAFSGALFLGRLFAGRALFGLGTRTTIIAAGIGAAAAGLVATVTDQPAVVGAAFLILGFALSAAAPAGFGLVESYPGVNPASAITAVTTIGYTGFIWSPPLLGWVADTFSLKATMAVIVLATLGIVAGGVLAPQDRRRP